MSLMGHSRPMHSVPVPINVRCYSNSDIIVRRSEVTRWANRGLTQRNMIFEAQIGNRGSLLLLPAHTTVCTGRSFSHIWFGLSGARH
jgi:hypothetical protein